MASGATAATAQVVQAAPHRSRLLRCTGDFDVKEMKQLIEGSLGEWRVANGQPATPPTVPNPPLPPQSTADRVTKHVESGRGQSQGVGLFGFLEM